MWCVVGLAVLVPLFLASQSPLLAWRQPVYIVAGFAGIVAMGFILIQPLLAGGFLSGLPTVKGRRVHRWVGVGLLVAVILHVAGLWLTSPPDVIDALLFRSPTPFSVWGVLAMWAVFLSAALAVVRRRLRPRTWRRAHTALALVIAVGSVAHALQIEGTMEPVSRLILCGLVVLAMGKVMIDLRVWRLWGRRGS